MRTSYKFSLKCFISIVGALAAYPGAADPLTIPTPQKAAEAAFDGLPTRGLTPSQVRQQLGEPQQTNGPVGEPPISSWEYPDFLVYFEGNRVLHTVLKRPQAGGN